MPKGKPREEDLTLKIPEASGFVVEDSIRSMAVQRAFISFLARKMAKMAPGLSLNDCAVMVVQNTGAKFREWLKGLAEVETNEDFLETYGPPEGAKKIFDEIFPNQDIEDFLRLCLNEDDSGAASRRSEEVRSRTLDIIDK